MKGLDTNVLVRFLTADEPRQADAARRLVEAAELEGERLHLSTLVLVELVWVLRGTRYGISRAEVAEVLEALLESTVFEIQDRDLVHRAAGAFRAGAADFSDYLIGELDRRAGCTSTLTFDRRLLTTRGFEEPSEGRDGPSKVSEP